MDTNPDYWKIRFGQLFQAALQDSGKRLEDHLYFWPDDLALDVKEERSYDAINLNLQRDTCQQHFGTTQPIPAMPAIAAGWDVTIVIVPGIGHHVLENKVLEQEIAWLHSQGQKVIYAYYDESFESVDDCAQSLYENNFKESTDTDKLVFISFSKGCPITMALLTNDDYLAVRRRTLALVALSSPIRGTRLAESWLARLSLKILSAYKRYLSKVMRRGIPLMGRLIGKMILFFKPSRDKDWQTTLDKVLDIEDEITDLPEGIKGLTRQASTRRFARVTIDPAIRLFTLSAVHPPTALRHKAGNNPDKLFLYYFGMPLYMHTVFCDSQVSLPESRFFPANGPYHDLGIVRADHWGLTMDRVFPASPSDPFPRREMVWAICAVLHEYLQGNHLSAE
ncbi:MAG: hypothetical protein OEZ39_02665 [Gammaproteobacteria bacterium]|nr:hypothetical protein [Gammaproteobacteria bacterium]MDH5650758.1 hypothetical protein [Gammaproteobacteria bacterium]